MKKLVLNFFPLSGKMTAKISQSILYKVELSNLDVMMYVYRRYNASTLSGTHIGVQQKIKNMNPKALFIPCGNYTLNLVGVYALGSSQLSDRFFAVFEKLCAFFCCLSS